MFQKEFELLLSAKCMMHIYTSIIYSAADHDVYIYIELGNLMSKGCELEMISLFWNPIVLHSVCGKQVGS